jgi:hypothetical protein
MTSTVQDTAKLIKELADKYFSGSFYELHAQICNIFMFTLNKNSTFAYKNSVIEYSESKRCFYVHVPVIDGYDVFCTLPIHAYTAEPEREDLFLCTSSTIDQVAKLIASDISRSCETAEKDKI